MYNYSVYTYVYRKVRILSHPRFVIEPHGGVDRQPQRRAPAAWVCAEVNEGGPGLAQSANFVTCLESNSDGRSRKAFANYRNNSVVGKANKKVYSRLIIGRGSYSDSKS